MGGLEGLAPALRRLNEMDFAYPWVLWSLLGLLVVAGWQIWRAKRAQGSVRFSALQWVAQGGRGWRRSLLWLSPACRLLALALVLVALARPQNATERQMHAEGIDIMLVLDMSGSMEAVDMAAHEVQHLVGRGVNPENRYDIAIAVLKSFVHERAERCRGLGAQVPRCDRLGMVVFGPEAFLEFPLTLDYEAIQRVLDYRQLGDIDGSGTAIGNAVARAVAALRHSDARQKAIVMITDGDRRGGHISPAQSVEMAQHFRIPLFPILVGKEGVALIAVGSGRERRYREVEFPINPDLLKEMASQTGGAYYRSEQMAEVQRDLHDILDRFEVSAVEDSVVVFTDEHYAPFTLGALALLTLSVLLGFLLIRRFP